jgi:DNA polymerase-1
MHSFKEIWFCDFEFNGGDGNRPDPVCVVARELNTGRSFRLWREDLRALKQAPFPVGGDCLFVSYFASAELSCFLELGWRLPVNILDLFVEHRVATNGRPSPFGDSLLGALRLRGLTAMAGDRKDAMRDLVLSRQAWSPQEQKDILDYCSDDVAALEALLLRMAGGIDWPRALLRGRYMAAVADMERTGIPLDVELHRRLAARWNDLKAALIREVDKSYGVYDGTCFRAAKFKAWLQAQNIQWPLTDSGALSLSDDTFRDAARTYPQVAPLRELRSTISRLRLTGLQIGSDGRNRCLLSPFGSNTGRNQPSNAKYIFGPSVWMRGLIRPPPGRGLAYVDFSAQEIAIAAALSGDERMVEGYSSGDPYISFAKDAGLVPPDATKKSHPEIREKCKTTCLGVNYGMSAQALAYRLSVSDTDAVELLRLHKQTYATFWRWSDGVVATAMLGKPLHTVFGWVRRCGSDISDRSIMNFPMQSNGAEMLRIACIAATEGGVEVAAPVHDALLIEAPLQDLDDAVTTTRELMARAGAAVTGGLPVRTDGTLIRNPDRYSDPRGVEMWRTVMRLLTELEMG